MSNKGLNQIYFINKFKLFVITAASIVAIVIIVTTSVFDNLITKQKVNEVGTNQTAASSNTKAVQGRLLPDFPKFPQHPNIKVVRSSSMKFSDKVEYQAVYSTNTDYSEIIGWYEDALAEEGFDVIDRGENELEAIVSGDTYFLSVNKAGSGETYLNLTAKIDKD